ncbi:DNA topoisomerase 2-binding protein 1-like isoform X2 [Varroa destructor]|uniref:BRCT domain-containing protein n=1 Tax=Varroa destructor TaxID=109461 RepID=A0A7M7L2T5_VARDE|nr:DNA topoisomerase 2-binding protein 1-like isoform X2 [Varroa destructor]
MDFSRRRNISRLEGPSSTLIEISARDVSLTIFCEPYGDAGRTARLQEAFDAYQTHAVGETKWMTLEEMREFQAQSQHQNQLVHYVCDPFEGPVFDLAQASEHPVWGPLVLLRCLRDKRALPLFQKGQAIYSLAMKNVIATFSSVTPARRVGLTQRIRWMGGRMEAALNNTVTHVVTDEVGSKKYIVGAQRGLALQTTAWIDRVWDTTQHELKHALSIAEEFRTPIFANLTITTSGLAEDEKAEVTKLIQDNGGTYTGKLTKANTHLVVREGKGAKYTAALKWQLHVVTPDWVSNSVKKGFMVDPIQYLIGESIEPLTGKNDTVMNSSVTSVASTISRTTNVSSGSTAAGDPAYSEVLRLKKEDVSGAGQFLDGCSVHVFGVRDKTLLDRLHQIINQAGGLREDAFNDGVTHIITIPSASGLSELQRNIEATFASPAVILPSWLVACVREKSLVSPVNYAVPGFDPPPEAGEGVDRSDGEHTTHSSACLGVTANPNCSCSSVGNKTSSKHLTLGTSVSASVTGCLNGKAFCLTQELRTMYLNVVHDLPALREGIESLGGHLVDSEDTVGPSQELYMVYTNMVSATLPPPNSITILFLEGVIKQRRWTDPSVSLFFQVLHAPRADVPNGVMSSVVVTPTGFSEQEVTSMSRALALFGASLQAVMVRSSKPDKKLWATTHLVCATDKSNGKLEAAKRWKIPAVTLEWVLVCAREGCRVGVKEYLIDPGQWESLPDAAKKSPRRPPPETPVEKRKRPIEFQTTPSQGLDISRKQTPPPITTIVTPGTAVNNSGTAAASDRRPSGAQTPMLSSQRMREIYEECSRFKTPKRSNGADVDSPGMPRIGADKISEMVQQIQDSPLRPYDIPEASFNEKCSQAVSAKSCLTIGRPLDGIVAVIDEDGLKPCSLELKMSIERLGGWVCHTVERCTLIILPPSHKQSDDGRRLRVSAQRLNKPIVGVEWVWATIDTMERPLLVEFPPNYEEKYGAPYVRCKKLSDYVPKWEDSDLDISVPKVDDAPRTTTKDTSGVTLENEADLSMPVVEQPSVESSHATPRQKANTAKIEQGSVADVSEDEDQDKSVPSNNIHVCNVSTEGAASSSRFLRPRRSSVASVGSEVPATPMEAPQADKTLQKASSAASVSKDPLREILRRNSGRQATPLVRRLSRADMDDTNRSQNRRSQLVMASQCSIGSVLADIETQPEEGVTYGRTMTIPTSTQLNSTVYGDAVAPNFGDVSMVRHCTDEMMNNPAVTKATPKRLRDTFEVQDTPGKRFKKNPVKHELTHNDTTEVASPPLTKKSTEKVYELYHLDEETDKRCRHLITELGGAIVDNLSAEVSAPSSIEKITIIDPTQPRIMKKSSLLQQLACGGWVLAPSYVDDSSAAGYFLPEAEYMLGVGTKGQPESNIRKISAERFACWPRWRKQRLEYGTGAFDKWKVGLFSSTVERERGHRLLLTAGGAVVLNREDMDALKEATHIFVTKGDTSTARKLRAKLGPSALIVAPDYMLHYLSLGEVDPAAFAIQ